MFPGTKHNKQSTLPLSLLSGSSVSSTLLDLDGWLLESFGSILPGFVPLYLENGFLIWLDSISWVSSVCAGLGIGATLRTISAKVCLGWSSKICGWGCTSLDG